jgi:uncharacterized membrane protein YfcA
VGHAKLTALLSWTGQPAWTLLALVLVIVLAYTVYGLTGFGSSITAIPLLAQLIPLRLAVPMMLVFDLAVGVLMGVANRRIIERREVRRLLPWMLAGMALGVTLLVKAPERALLLLLGAFVLAYSAWSLLLRIPPRPISQRWAAPFGAFGGIFTALYGTGGPVYTIYLARRISDTAVLRATNSGLILMAALCRLVLFTGLGLYGQPQLLPLATVLLPFALLGLFLGHRLHRRLPDRHVVRIIWVILIAGGIGLLWRGLAGP